MGVGSVKTTLVKTWKKSGSVIPYPHSQSKQHFTNTMTKANSKGKKIGNLFEAI